MRKRIFKLLLCMSVISLMPMMSSCYDDEDYLVGYWWSVDDLHDIIRLHFEDNNMGTCEEYDYYGDHVIASDLFEWRANNNIIHIYFRTGTRGHWEWDYRKYDGRTVEINGRIFSRDSNYRGYRSKQYQKDEIKE